MGFSEDIAKFVKKTKGNDDLLVRKTVLDVGKRLVERTPVGDAVYWQSPPPPGYTGGHARANWQHSIGAPKILELSGTDKDGSATVANILTSMANNGAGPDHYITNSVPYIVPLEDGHSRQAPNGMVGLTIVEFKGIVDDIAKGLR